MRSAPFLEFVRQYEKKYFAGAALLYFVLFTFISAMGILHVLRQLDKRVPERDNGFYTPMGELTTDDAAVAQCVQVSQAVQSEFALSPYKGELLKDSAFIYHEGDSIPVVERTY